MYYADEQGRMQYKAMIEDSQSKRGNVLSDPVEKSTVSRLYPSDFLGGIHQRCVFAMHLRFSFSREILINKLKSLT